MEAGYADLTLPSITLHEAVIARRTLLAKGRREVDTRAIVRTAIARRELVEAATKKTAAARRGIASSKSKWMIGDEARSAVSTPANLYPLSRIQIELE